jgi:hypothetical protein
MWYELDPDGAVLAARRFGDESAAQWGSDVSLDDATGDTLIAGTFEGSLTTGGDTLVASPSRAVFLSRFDASGRHVWSAAYSSSDGIVQLEDLSVDGQGTATAIGFFLGAIDFGGGPLTSAGAQDVFVASLDRDGRHAASHRLGGPGSDFGFALAHDPLGQPVVTGYFTDSFEIGGPPVVSAGSWDIFLAALARPALQ